MDAYSDVIVEELPNELPPRRPFDPELRLKPGTLLKNRPTYRLSEKELEGLKAIISTYLAANQIYSANPRFASPSFLVPKKLGGYRLLVDMRQVNEGLEDGTWPIPNIQELLDRTRGAKLFSIIDLAAGYQQMRITENSKWLTAFRTPIGTYCWRTLPQGCKASPPAFCHMMASIFGDLPFVLVYLDDVLIVSRTAEEHEEHLKIVFDRFRDNKLFAAKKKVMLFQRKVDYLGYLLSPEGVATNPQKIETIQKWPAPLFLH